MGTCGFVESSLNLLKLHLEYRGLRRITILRNLVHAPLDGGPSVRVIARPKAQDATVTRSKLSAIAANTVAHSLALHLKVIAAKQFDDLHAVYLSWQRQRPHQRLGRATQVVQQVSHELQLLAPMENSPSAALGDKTPGLRQILLPTTLEQPFNSIDLKSQRIPSDRSNFRMLRNPSRQPLSVARRIETVQIVVANKVVGVFVAGGNVRRNLRQKLLKKRSTSQNSRTCRKIPLGMYQGCPGRDGKLTDWAGGLPPAWGPWSFLRCSAP